MVGRVRICLVLALLVLTAACRRLDKPVRPTEGGITVETLAEIDMVPLAWGDLISVHSPGYPQFVLFFQDRQGTVRLVIYDAERRELRPTATVVRRS